MRKLAVTGAVTAAVLALVLGACNWQVPESVNIKGSPDVVVPGGTADFDLDDLNEFLDEFEDELSIGDNEDFQVSVDDEPYTLLAVWEVVTDVQVDNDSLPVEWDDLTLKGDFPIDAADFLGELPEGIDFDEILARITLDADAGVGLQIGLNIGEPENPDEKTNYTFHADLAADENEAQNDFLTEEFNDRQNFDVYYLFELNGTGSVDSIKLEIEIPFAFTANKDRLDPVPPHQWVLFDIFDDDDDEDDDNPLLMEEDIFGRDPDDDPEDLEDLQDLLDALKGSSARLVFTLANTSIEFADDDGLTIAMLNWEQHNVDGKIPTATKTNEDNWDFRATLRGGTNVIELSSETLNAMIDGYEVNGVKQYVPEFLILFEDGTSFQFHRGRELNVSDSSLRVSADLDYKFDLD